ncbi:MAG: ribosome maturation factor RimP [Candidatus Omnitrophota bacterium]
MYGIDAKIRTIVARHIEEAGADLVDIQHRREGRGLVVRVLVDRPDGITIGECGALSSIIGEAFDREAVIQEAYILEVSSPGLDRPIITENDFKRVLGKELVITTTEKVEGKIEHAGVFVGMNDAEIVIESSGLSTPVPKDKIAKAVRSIKLK